MRKLILYVATVVAFAFAPLAAEAQIISRGQTGAVGTIVTCTDPSGVTSQCVLPMSTPVTAAGVQMGSTASPNAVQGNAASSATDSGNPVKVGGVFNSTLPTFTNGQRGDLQISPRGSLNVNLWDDGSGVRASVSGGGGDAVSTGTVGLWTNARNYVFNGTSSDRQLGDANGTVIQAWGLAANRWSYAAAASGIVNTTTAVTIKAAAGASVRNYLVSCQVDHDTLGGATELVWRDGAAGTVLARKKLQTTAVEGMQVTFSTPLRGTANTLIEVATLTAVTGGVYVNCQGFTAS